MQLSTTLRKSIDITIYYVGDVHWSIKNPRLRTDNYYREVKGLLKQVADLVSKEKGPTLLIFGGDVGHRPVWAPLQVRSFLQMFAYLPSNIRTMVVPGNHDLWGYRIDTIQELTLGVLEMSKIIVPRQVGCLNVGNVGLIPVPESTTLDDLSKVDPVEDRVYILAAHQPVGPKGSRYCVGYKSVDLPSWVDVALFSHIHMPFGPWKNGNETIYVNPGPIGRRSKDEQNIHPSIIKIQGDKLEVIRLKARAGKTLFDQVRIERDDQEKARVLSVAMSVATDLKTMDLEQQITEVATKGKYSDAAKKKLLEEIKTTDDSERSREEG